MNKVSLKGFKLKSLRRYKQTVYFVLAIIIVLVVITLTYLAVNPIEDKETATKGKDKLNTLNMSFDKKTLEEIQDNKASSLVSGAAGRVPFMPY